MALKILKSEEMLLARWNQPRMTRAEAARQILATMSGQKSDVSEYAVKSKPSRRGLLRTEN